MKNNLRKIVITSCLAILGGVLAVGQGCSPSGGGNGSSQASSLDASNNGDYYSGKLSAISDSVSSYSSSQSQSASTLDSAPASTDPNACAQLSLAVCTAESKKEVQYTGHEMQAH